MRWKQKALIQRMCARLPAGREQVYYFIQRRFGRVANNYDPTELLRESVRLSAALVNAGVPIGGARVMEVGTGWRMDMPIGYFLCGAASVITVDLYRYRKDDLVLGTLAYIRSHRDKFIELFSQIAPREDVIARLNALDRVSTIEQLEQVARIKYLAPQDAASTGLPDGSIDAHVSYTVLEHIPGPVLVRILREANRLLTTNGVALHHIDPSDHRAHVDDSISFIDFLQYSDAEWDAIAGNQFAYHNRLRADDYERIYRDAGQRVIEWQPHINERGRKALDDGFPVHAQYRDRSRDVLSASVLHVLSKPVHEPT